MSRKAIARRDTLMTSTNQEEAVKKVLAAQRAITKLENQEQLNSEDIQALTWAVVELSIEVLLDTTLTDAEIAYAQNLAERISENVE
jgi:hypothetical protein